MSKNEVIEGEIVSHILANRSTILTVKWAELMSPRVKNRLNRADLTQISYKLNCDFIMPP